MNRVIVTTLIFLLFACEPPPEEPQLEIELLGCVDEPQPWDTCADFCEWDGAVCAENACEGITARSYPIGYHCFDEEPELFTDSPIGCSDTMIFDDANRYYYDCCCDYR